MSDEGVNKIKSLIKENAEVAAKKMGQIAGEASVEAKKALDAASPVAKSAIAELGAAFAGVRQSFTEAMRAAEAKAKAKDPAAGDEQSGSGPQGPAPK